MAASAAVPQLTKSKPEGIDLYARFALAGALGCSITHGAFTPVDVYVSSILIHPYPYSVHSGRSRNPGQPWLQPTKT